jgi:hypothetical protein
MNDQMIVGVCVFLCRRRRRRSRARANASLVMSLFFSSPLNAQLISSLTSHTRRPLCFLFSHGVCRRNKGQVRGPLGRFKKTHPPSALCLPPLQRATPSPFPLSPRTTPCHACGSAHSPHGTFDCFALKGDKRNASTQSHQNRLRPCVLFGTHPPPRAHLHPRHPSRPITPVFGARLRFARARVSLPQHQKSSLSLSFLSLRH